MSFLSKVLICDDQKTFANKKCWCIKISAPSIKGVANFNIKCCISSFNILYQNTYI